MFFLLSRVPATKHSHHGRESNGSKDPEAPTMRMKDNLPLLLEKLRCQEDRANLLIFLCPPLLRCSYGCSCGKYKAEHGN